MKCEYCGKSVKDMPDHLSKNKYCIKQHADKLAIQLKQIIYLGLSHKEIK